MQRRNTRDDFWRRVKKSKDCWIWIGSTNTAGYGQFKIGGIQMDAHLFAWNDLVGVVPKGLELDHLCRNPLCVNPIHLEPVTHRENMLRGISPVAINAAKKFCKRGHPLFGSNVRIGKQRTCRTCFRLYMRNWRKRDR